MTLYLSGIIYRIVTIYDLVNMNLHISRHNPALKCYLKQVQKANALTNTVPIPINSTDAQPMHHMIQEAEPFFQILEQEAIPYTVDGAISISLRTYKQRKSYIRHHRDIDILLPKDTLTASNHTLQTQPTNQKWMICTWNTDDLSKGLSFVPFDTHQLSPKDKLVTLPILDDKTIDTKRYNRFTMIDIHYLSKRNAQYEYHTIPVDIKKILHAETATLPSGREIPVIPLPYLTAAKATSTRSQDIYDISVMMSMMTPAQKITAKKLLQRRIECAHTHEKTQISSVLKDIAQE